LAISDALEITIYTVTERALKKQILAAIATFLLFGWVKAFDALGDASEGELSQWSEIKLFVAADESSEVVATFNKRERYVPLAEATGIDGAKWYLVKFETGATGWIKETDKEETKKLASLFKPVPLELSFPKPKEISSASSDSASGNRIAVPVESNGSSVIVRVTFNGSLTANLALDTGATTTVISRRIARSLRLATLGSRTMFGIGGSVNAPVAHVDSVRVGEAEVSNLAVSILDFSSDPRIEGLLGLNFLNQFEFSLDARKRQLLLVRR
jgi:predicted aspartyl protease